MCSLKWAALIKGQILKLNHCERRGKNSQNLVAKFEKRIEQYLEG